MENSELSNIKNKFPGESVQKEKVKTQGVTNNSSNIFGNKFCEISVYNSKKKYSGILHQLRLSHFYQK